MQTETNSAPESASDTSVDPIADIIKTWNEDIVLGVPLNAEMLAALVTPPMLSDPRFPRWLKQMRSTGAISVTDAEFRKAV